MPNRSGKSAAAFIGKAACCFLQLIRFLLGFMQINYARMQQTGQPFLSCPVLFWDLCSSHFCITSSSRCDADDGVNPMETVRLMLYRFLPFFSAPRRTAPIGAVAARFTPVFVAECAFGQAVLFFECADGAVAARLSCHGEPPSRKIETC